MEEKLFLGQRRSSIETTAVAAAVCDTVRHSGALGRRPNSPSAMSGGRERGGFSNGARKLNVTGETFRGRAKPSLSRRDAAYTSAHRSAVRTVRPPSPSTATSTPADPTCCKRPSESWPWAATDLTRVTSWRYRGKYWPRANHPRQLCEIAGSLFEVKPFLLFRRYQLKSFTTVQYFYYNPN